MHPCEEISALELAQALTEQPVLVLDVREPEEFMADHLPEAINLPLSTLSASRAKELAQHHTGKGLVVLVCNSGRRSTHAASLLAQAGVSPIKSLKGGMQAWRHRPGRTQVALHSVLQGRLLVLSSACIAASWLMGTPWLLLIAFAVSLGSLAHWWIYLR